MKKLYTYLIIGLMGMLSLPSSVFATQGGGDLEGVEGFMETILNLLDLLVLIIMALALVFFLWGVAKFILNAGDPEEQSKGKQIMFWGLIGLFVMTAVWGLVVFIQDQLGISDTDDVDAPEPIDF
ncbi:MAG: pilin [Candidatus Paceibacterota bacterium]